jgi:hypothetical protein
MPTTATHVWRPSVSRTVTIDSFVPAPRGTTATAPSPLNWPGKDPTDVLDYQVVFTPAVLGNCGDAISTLDVWISPSNPGDLVVNSATADGTSAVIWLGGGQANTVYTVTVSVMTFGGRTIQRTVLLPVLPLSVQPAPDTALEVAPGVVLTDQNGNPVLTASA